MIINGKEAEIQEEGRVEAHILDLQRACPLKIVHIIGEEEVVAEMGANIIKRRKDRERRSKQWCPLEAVGGFAASISESWRKR